MSRKPNWKPIADAATDLEEEIGRLVIIAALLVEQDPSEDVDRVNYLTEQLQLTTDRARVAMRATLAARHAPAAVAVQVAH